MMRWLAIFSWLIPIALTAQIDPPAKAREVAWGVMGGPQASLKAGLIQDSVIPFGQADLPSAFVVTFKPAGFVIVSSPESGSAVLGYSLTSAFPARADHPLRSWFIPQYQSPARQPDRRKDGQGTRFFTDHLVMPLITAQWGQGDPWNLYCPSDSSGARALAGCVAVAMSQIMHKWQWPVRGTGSVTYTPLLHPEYGTLTALFDTTHYRWDLTHDTYPSDVSALILYHTGVASLMNYDPQLSSTSVDQYAVPALVNNFSFNPAMIFRQKDALDHNEWIRLLQQELDNSRPVLYAGTTPDGKSSHAFNIDGYRDETFFHFNWGWNGAGDGWYSLTGMAGGGAEFTTQQGAIFGLQPANLPLHDRPSSVDILAGDGFAQLFWDQPVIANFSHFNVYRDGNLISQTAETQYLDEGMTNGQRYSYEISASYQGQTPGESAATPALTVIPWLRMQPGYSQSFESGSEGWQLLDDESGFRIGQASSLGIGANPGRIAAIRSEGHPAGEQVSDYLISPVIYPADFAHTAISFDYLFRQKSGIDSLTLLWRNFNDGRWQILAVLDSTGGYSDWKTLHYYLPSTAPHTPIQVAFYYNDAFGQGYGAAIDNFAVYEVAIPAIPGVSIGQTDLCQAQAVTFTDLSVGPVTTWDWDFGEGAEPRHATTRGPHLVIYTTPGKKTVKLSLNHLDHLRIPDGISVRNQPVAGFSYSRHAQQITFSDQSLHAEQMLWDFGDGETSTIPNPVHTYLSKNLFEVRQIVYNGTCSPDTLTKFVDMRPGTGFDEEELSSNLIIYPNPTQGKLTLLWDISPTDPLKIRISSISGKVCLSGDYQAQKEITLNLSDFPDGFYVLQIASGRWIRNEQIIKINN